MTCRQRGATLVDRIHEQRFVMTGTARVLAVANCSADSDELLAVLLERRGRDGSSVRVL